MYHPIRGISVTALNIFHSKDAMRAERHIAGAVSPCRSCLFFPVSPLCQVFDIDWSWR